MLKVFEEVDGDLYLDILLENKDIEILHQDETVEVEFQLAKGKTMFIGIKFFDEDSHEKVKRKRKN